MQRTIDLDKPTAEVYEFMVNARQLDVLQSNEFRLQPQGANGERLRLGSRFVGQVGVGTMPVRAPYRVTRLELNRLILLKSEDMTFDGEVAIKLDPLGLDRTRLTLSVYVRPRYDWTGMYTFFVNSNVEPFLNRYLSQTLVKVKQAVES